MKVRDFKPVATLCWVLAAATTCSGEVSACPKPLAIPQVMGIKTRYIDLVDDPSQSILDEQKVAQQQNLREAIDRPVSTIIALADLYRSRSDAAVVTCLGLHFATLADSRAFEGARGNADNFYRNWMIASLAIAYLKAKQPLDRLPSSGRVRAWLSRNAAAIQRFNELRVKDGNINNHYYWGGAAVTAVGALTGDLRFLAFGRRVLSTGLSQIDDEGFLHAELQRGKRARHYHLFAAQSLAATALLGHFKLTPDEAQQMERLSEALADAFEHSQGGRIGRAARSDQLNEKDLGPLLFVRPFVKKNPQLVRRIDRLSRGAKTYEFFLGGKSDFLLVNAPDLTPAYHPRRGH